MNSRIRTLILYIRNHYTPRRVRYSTLTGWLGIEIEKIPRPLRSNRYLKYATAEEYIYLSYVKDWLEAFYEHPRLDVTLCDIHDRFSYWREARRIAQYDFIVILHSATGDNMDLLNSTSGYFQNRRGKLLLFVGNEYSLMPQKIGFAQDVEADYIGSQLPLKNGQWLYSECISSTVLETPHALNPALYRPGNGPRPIDIGFRGDRYGWYIGDIERNEVIRHAEQTAISKGLSCDIKYERYPRDQWSAFLNSCKAVVGAESCTYYLEKDDHTYNAVNKYLHCQPDATFDDVYERFFRNYANPVSGKMLSSRHFEPIGAKTCQILMEGRYNGILKADEHYINVKKDFSNLDDALERFKDESYRLRMVERTYDYVMAQHTYRHRVSDVIDAMFP